MKSSHRAHYYLDSVIVSVLSTSFVICLAYFLLVELMEMHTIYLIGALIFAGVGIVGIQNHCGYAIEGVMSAGLLASIGWVFYLRDGEVAVSLIMALMGLAIFAVSVPLRIRVRWLKFGFSGFFPL